jgi:hypothetical protein
VMWTLGEVTNDAGVRLVAEKYVSRLNFVRSNRNNKLNFKIIYQSIF